MKIYNYIFAFFFLLNGFSQTHKGAIDNIKEDGLHKIKLSQEVRSAINDKFSSFRIKDKQNNEVPYVLVFNSDRKFSKFTPITIASKKIIKDSITSIILENKLGKKQEHIILKIANTDLVKSYTISGSNDGENWFGLVSHKRLKPINLPEKPVFEKTIYFPLNTYKLLRIDFDDSYSLPIEIIEAGIYKSEIFKQSPVEVNSYEFNSTQNNEQKTTVLNFSADNASQINYISFDIDTKFYLRKAKIFVKRTRKVKKRTETYDQLIDQIELNYNNDNTFSFSNLNEKEFSIEIENKDNPPLEITNIQLYQKPVHVIANFEKDNAYYIEVDDSFNKPSYDLGNFISNKTKGIKSTSITNFQKQTKELEETTTPSFWQTATFMWICIIVGGIFVTYFALSLLKDIGKES